MRTLGSVELGAADLTHQSQRSHPSCILGLCGSPLGPRELFLVKGLTLGVGVAWQEPRLQVEDPVYSAGGLRSEGPVSPPYTGMHLSSRTQNPLGLDVGGPMSPLPAPLERPRE